MKLGWSWSSCPLDRSSSSFPQQTTRQGVLLLEKDPSMRKTTCCAAERLHGSSPLREISPQMGLLKGSIFKQLQGIPFPPKTQHFPGPRVKGKAARLLPLSSRFILRSLPRTPRGRSGLCASLTLLHKHNQERKHEPPAPLPRADVPIYQITSGALLNHSQGEKKAEFSRHDWGATAAPVSKRVTRTRVGLFFAWI